MRYVANSSGFNLNWFEISGGPVADVPDLQGTGPVLHPCYPNPFNPVTTISYELSSASRVGLTVYDLAGKRVKTPVTPLVGSASESITSLPP